MDPDMKKTLRPAVSTWIEEHYPEAEEMAPDSGQRFVYRTPDGRAIKILPPLDEDDRIRCEREVRFLRDSQVVGLPRALTSLEEVEIADLVMLYYEERWINAQNLWDRLESVGPGPELATRVLTRGAAILSEIHEHQVVHRDISPGNLLVDDSAVDIVDLGLAKYLDLDPLTRSDQKLKMTVPFASPEQLTSGSAHLGPATDVYSLGMVTAFAANGTLAFIGAEEPFVWDEYLTRMAHRDLIDPTEIPPIVLKMIHPLAIHRPTAADVAASL